MTEPAISAHNARVQVTTDLLGMNDPPLRTWIAGKIHGVYVTATHLDYHGSVSIGRALLEAAEMQVYEQVHVVNLDNGHRWVTYALQAEDDYAFECNGGGALLARIADRCVVMTFAQSRSFLSAPVVQIQDLHNRDWQLLRYEPSGEPLCLPG